MAGWIRSIRSAFVAAVVSVLLLLVAVVASVQATADVGCTTPAISAKMVNKLVFDDEDENQRLVFC